MRRLMAVIASNRVGLKPLVTHRFKLDQIEGAYKTEVALKNDLDELWAIRLTNPCGCEESAQSAL